MHPTVKPVVLVPDAILDCSRRKAIVLDVFADPAPRWSLPSAPAGAVAFPRPIPTRQLRENLDYAAAAQSP